MRASHNTRRPNSGRSRIWRKAPQQSPMMGSNPECPGRARRLARSRQLEPKGNATSCPSHATKPDRATLPKRNSDQETKHHWVLIESTEVGTDRRLDEA